MAFPIIKGKWSSSFGLAPYSTVNNKSVSRSTLDGDISTEVLYQGQGGLTSLNWSNGFNLGESFFAGARTSAMFGSVGEFESTRINDGGESYVVDFTDRTSYSGLKFDLGFGYRKFINNERAVNFGLLLELEKRLNGSHDQWIETGVLPRRAVLQNDPTYFQLPSTIGFGASYQVLNKLTIGSDLVVSNWESSESSGNVNTSKFGIGAQFTPDYASVNRYLARATYRTGFSVGTLPFVVDGKKVKELGINFGGSFPVGFSNLDWAVKYGSLGTSGNNQIRENYFRIVIGATMTDRWFIKRRYD